MTAARFDVSKSRKTRPAVKPKEAKESSSPRPDQTAQGTVGNAALVSAMPPQDVGKEIIPTLSTANQLSKVVVRGYDPVKKKEIVGTPTPSADVGKDEDEKKDPKKRP